MENKECIMRINPEISTNLRLLLPEVIWLEPEHFEQARDISNQVKSEANQWQTYLNVLALLGFEQWLSAHMPEQAITFDTNMIETGCHLKLGDFKFCLITAEHLLDEVVNIPTEAIDTPELTAHFYVVIEVSEEQEEVILRGCLRYDQLVNSCNRYNLQGGYYQLPLSLFDTEPNHLLHYCRYLQPTAIPLPIATTSSFSQNIVQSLNQTRITLSQWLQGVFDEGWLAIEALSNPEVNLAFSTRSSDASAKRAKLIDLGMQLGHQTVALLMNVTEDADNKLNILIQLHPSGGERFLPPQIQLTLLSKAGKTLQQVQSRTHDNYVQLRAFKGEPGKRFSVEVSLEDHSIKEDFEI
jgi:hypothetical protein